MAKSPDKKHGHREKSKKGKKKEGPELFTLEEAHGARELPSVLVNGYSLMVRDKDGFAGDQASPRVAQITCRCR